MTAAVQCPPSASCPRHGHFSDLALQHDQTRRPAEHRNAAFPERGLMLAHEVAKASAVVSRVAARFSCRFLRQQRCVFAVSLVAQVCKICDLPA